MRAEPIRRTITPLTRTRGAVEQLARVGMLRADARATGWRWKSGGIHDDDGELDESDPGIGSRGADRGPRAPGRGPNDERRGARARARRTQRPPTGAAA